ncbi:uncharacterized protein LOC104887222 [Beta vulgaris subsp. vulgaris]|uniref:uncharacterized protein LOC104887222 n=1 Tax=Beta vulgaris subsp. vulgaris TaxID=3555 RepID=UPI002036B910|nr:uncharacterized protein LOC104887222 [Beta vulgaris subsp. vulgaris]
MAILPRFITFMFNSSYFQYETEIGQNHAAVRATSNTIISEKNFTKFEVVSSSVRGMVHIRTCYNNKYLQLNPSGVYYYATADEPEEDRAKRSCTLFRFVISGDNVTFFHQVSSAERPVIVYVGGFLGVTFASSPGAYRFRFRDMTSLVILPKHVLFKGDDGNYLRARKGRWLEFVANDPMDWRVHHISTLVPNTGDVRLLSPRFNLYWQRINSDWLKCDAGETGHQNLLNSIFRPIRQSSSSQGTTIALLNTTNNRYCQRWTSGGNAGRIRASALNVPSNALLTVEEAVRDREISNIRYHIDDARTYDMIPIRSVPQIVYNYGHSEAITKVGFSYTEVMEDMFSSSHSWKLSVTSTVKVRFIPKIVEGKLTANASYSGEVKWSQKNRTEERITSSTNAPVPARSITRVTLVVAQGSMDVPYSYKQRDVLMDGSLDIKDMHDGLFSGLNTFELQYIIGEPQSLPPNANPPPGQDNIVIVPGESRDLPRMAIPRTLVVDEFKVKGKDQGEKEEPIPMEEDDQGGEEELVPLPSKL